MSPPIYTPDGNEVTKIVLPDGSTASEVVAPDGSVVFDAGPEIPDSVVYQYVAESFASPWPDNVGSADMTVNGLTSTTFADGSDSVTGDGSDDHGLADGPETLGGNETFGIAFTAQFSSISSFVCFTGSWVGNVGNYLQIRSGVEGSGGEIALAMADNSNNALRVYTDGAFDDGTLHTIVVNKEGNAAADISIYVDDMGTAKPTSTTADKGFSHSSYANTTDMGFFARNNGGTIDAHVAMEAGVFEFNSEPYTQTEREDFVSRRPEVS